MGTEPLAAGAATPSIGPRDADAALRRGIAWAVALGLLLRIAIALASYGSNDTRILWRMGDSIGRIGLAEVYRTDPIMNHPPIPSYWSMASHVLAGGKLYPFGLWWKLPGIVADAASIALVGRIVARRAASTRAGVIAAILVAANPTSLLIVGYHGNTDGLLAYLTLLAWWLADRGRPFLAGLALAASINVKLGPAPTVLVMLACATTPREFLRMLAALAIGTLPFLWFLIAVGPEFIDHVLGYRPPSFSWLASSAWYARNVPWIGPLGLFFAFTHLRTVTQATLLIAVICAGLRRRAPARFDPLTIGAIYWAAFFFWNGGGFQYCIWAVPICAAVRPRLTFLYGIGASIYLGWAYFATLLPGWPLESFFDWFQLPVWDAAIAFPLLTVLALLISLLRRPRLAPAVTS